MPTGVPASPAPTEVSESVPINRPDRSDSNRIDPNHTGPDAGSISNMHDVLSDPERRRVLHALKEADDPVGLADLAAVVVPADAVATDDGPLPDRRLLHDHVVPMDEFGLVSYDRAAGTVSLPDEVTVSVHPDGR